MANGFKTGQPFHDTQEQRTDQTEDEDGGNEASGEHGRIKQ